MAYTGSETAAVGLSVVILTYNTPIDLLRGCLKSIFYYNDLQTALEVIVVDNNSSNQKDINHFVKKEFASVKMVNNASNDGYGAGNNLGVAYAKYEFAMLVNPDVEIVEQIFRWGIKRFLEDEDLLLLGIQQVDQHDRKTHSFLQRRLSITSFIQNRCLQKLNIFMSRYAVISGACFFLRRCSFMEIGGYDQNIFLYGEERYLHEHLLYRFPRGKIKMDFSKRYKHPITDRPFSIKITEQGLTSYFYLRQKLGFPHQKTLRSVIRYYKFLILFYTIKNKKASVVHARETLQLIDRKFRDFSQI